MKFTCDRCGKRFSSVDEPMPGRVYRIRCRCGNTIEIAAPRVVPDAVPHAVDGMPRHGGAPSGTKAVTPAGDAPVRNEKTPPSTPAPRRAGLTGSAAFEAPIPRVNPARRAAAAPVGPPAHAPHPHATPDAALMGDPWAAVPEPGAPAKRTRGTPAILPTAGAAAPASAAPELPPWQDAPFSEGLPPELELPRDDASPFATEPPAADADPFAVAAAHAARLDTADEAPAPVVAPPSAPPAPSAPLTPAAAWPAPSGPPAAAFPAPSAVVPEPSWPQPRTPSAAPVRPEPVPGAAREDEPIELSQSEQYELPHIRRREPRRRGAGRIVAAIGVSAAIGIAGATGAYFYLLGREVPWATAPRSPPPDVRADATPAQPSSQPQPSPEAQLATPEPAVARPAAPAPPAAKPAAPAPATVAKAESGEASRTPSAADRRAQAKAEEDRKAAERRAESERLAAERRAEADRKEAERVAAAERTAEAERKAAADGEAAAERREAERHAAEKKVAAADAAAEETLRQREPAAQKPSEPLADGLSPERMSAVIRANHASLEACVQGALADPATAAYAGRTVFLMVLVGPNGKADAALEDADLDGTAFGACIRRATSRMAFPAFRGEAVGARIPIVVGRAE